MSIYMKSVKSLFDLATNVFVRHVSLLKAYTEAIPPVLYESLLEASIRANRILSIRHLLLSWPLQTLSLVGSLRFGEQHALVLAHSLESGCNKLREVDLTHCMIGIRGTKLFLMLAAGKPLPNATDYCSNTYRTNRNAVAKFSIKESKDLPLKQSTRLSITADCYVDKNNYHLFLEVLEGNSTLHDFTVSHFHAESLGFKRVRKILRILGKVQATSVIGLDMEMNSLPNMTRFSPISENKVHFQYYQSFQRFSNLRHLNLSRNQSLGSWTICHILKHIPSTLTHLMLNSCGIKTEHAQSDFAQIAKLPCIQKLEHLGMDSNYLEEIGSGIMSLLQKCSGTLTFLSLEENRLTDKCIPTILKLLQPPFALKNLHIGENKFSSDSNNLLCRLDKQHKIMGLCTLF